MPEDPYKTARDVKPNYLEHFAWLESNRTEGFEDWHAEIKHAQSQGYTLVPPAYVIPHWSVAMTMKNSLPTLYVMRKDNEFFELRSCFDRRAGQIGYPIFYKKS